MQTIGRQLCLRPQIGRLFSLASKRGDSQSTQMQAELLRKTVAKHIVRKPEWRHIDSKGKVELTRDGSHLAMAMTEIWKYCTECTVTPTQYSNMLDLLRDLPESNQELELAGHPKIDIDQTKHAFDFLDKYTFDHYFELDSVYPSVLVLLRLQRFLNNEFVASAERMFGRSTVGANLPAIFRSRHVKSKAIELFMHNCTRAHDYKTKSANEAEFDSLMTTSQSELRFNNSCQFRCSATTGASKGQSLDVQGSQARE